MTSTLFLSHEGNFLEPLDSGEGSSWSTKKAGLGSFFHNLEEATGKNYHRLGFFRGFN